MTDMPRYQLGLQVDLNQGLLQGQEKILFTNCEDEVLDELVLRLYLNYYPLVGGFNHQVQVGGVTVDGEPAEISYIASNTAVVVSLPHPLAQGERIPLELGFALSLGSAYKERWTLASFYPLLAVYDETGWRTDIPTNGDLVYSESALYVVELTLPDNVAIAASGTEVNVRMNNDGTMTHTFLGPGLRDFALVFGEEMQRAQIDVDGTTIYLWHGSDDPLVEVKLRAAGDAVEIFDRQFGAYPFAEVDIVTWFDPEREWPGGGIEYPGIFFYTHGGDNWEYGLVHEVAHQWWFSVVGNDIHLEPWLDEALAEYSAYIYSQEIYGEEKARDIFYENVLKDYYEIGIELGTISGDEPVGLSVYDFPSYHAMYFWIVYGKGALFLDAWREELGDEVFFDFLQLYYHRYKYKVVTGENFLEVSEEVAGRELNTLYDAWVRK